MSGYQGKGAFLTRAFAPSEFSSQVESIRIDAGAHGGYGEDLAVSGERRTALGMYLSKAKWIQEIVSKAP